MGLSWQEYCSWLPFPAQGYLPHSDIKPMSPASPALADTLFSTEPPGKPHLSNRQKTMETIVPEDGVFFFR